MKKQVRASRHPHNNYFAAVASIKEVAEELIRFAAGARVARKLDFGTLTPASTSFIDRKLKASLSDLVYTCNTRDANHPVRVCFLFEHKSRKPGRALVLQLLRYILSILEAEEKQRVRPYSLTIPIVFYHGKERWNPQFLRELYGVIPKELERYLPGFEFLVIDIQGLSDAEITDLRDALLIRNIFLAMKHAWEDDFYRRNFAKVVIFEAANVREDALDLLVEMTLTYMQQVTTIKKEEYMEAIQALPKPKQKRVKTSWEQITEDYFQEGLEKGIEKGREEGMEIPIRQYLLLFPNVSDAEVVSLLGVPVELVQRVRASLHLKGG